MQLWTVPEWKGKLGKYKDMSLVEVINRDAGAVLWCVKKLNWQLSDDAKEHLQRMGKQTAHSHTGTKKHSNKYKRHF